MALFPKKLENFPEPSVVPENVFTVLSLAYVTVIDIDAPLTEFFVLESITVTVIV
jgi:hypothetical protein